MQIAAQRLLTFYANLWLLFPSLKPHIQHELIYSPAPTLWSTRHSFHRWPVRLQCLACQICQLAPDLTPPVPPHSRHPLILSCVLLALMTDRGCCTDTGWRERRERERRREGGGAGGRATHTQKTQLSVNNTPSWRRAECTCCMAQWRFF